MKTRERAHHLAAAASRFPFLGTCTADDLMSLVHIELGHAEILDDFQIRDRAYARASGPGYLLHIISGNTPAAGLQSLIRGLLLGAHNLCKLPSEGLPELIAFKDVLPPELAQRIELSHTLPEAWIAQANAVVVFGSDETVAHFHRRMRPDQIFVGHGHRLSIGVIFEDPEFASVEGAARDASVFDQQGCLSPQVFFVRHDARHYAARLANAMAQFAESHPRAPLALSEANAIRSLREEFAFRAANEEGLAIWQSPASTAWTVVFDSSPDFPNSPLNRFVFVKPLPDDLSASLAPVRRFLSACGYWPATLSNAKMLATLGASRLCPIGQMQSPPLAWHQDGEAVLAPFVRWIDAEIVH